MAFNVNPEFIQRQQAQQAPLAPTPVPDQTAGIAANSLQGLADYLTKAHSTNIENALKQAQTARFQGEAAQLPFKAKQEEYSANKMGAEVDMQKLKNKYLEDMMREGTSTPSTAPQSQPTQSAPTQADLGMGQSDITKPPVVSETPKYSDPGYKFDAYKEAEADPIHAATARHILLAAGAQGDYSKGYQDQLKLKQDVAAQKIQEEFAKQLPYLMDDTKAAPTYQDARQLLTKIDPRGILKPVDANELLKNFPTQMDVRKLQDSEANVKAQREATQAQRDISNQNTRTQMAATAAQRDIENSRKDQTLRDKAEAKVQDTYEKTIGGARGNLGLNQVEANVTEVRQMLEHPTKLEASLVKEKLQRIINPSYGISKQIYASTTPGGELDKLWNNVSNIFAGGNKYMTDNQKKQVNDVINIIEQGTAAGHAKVIEKQAALAAKINKEHPDWDPIQVTPQRFSFDKNDYSNVPEVNAYNEGDFGGKPTPTIKTVQWGRDAQGNPVQLGK